jgi:hypothetical protein
MMQGISESRLESLLTGMAASLGANFRETRGFQRFADISWKIEFKDGFGSLRMASFLCPDTAFPESASFSVADDMEFKSTTMVNNSLKKHAGGLRGLVVFQNNSFHNLRERDFMTENTDLFRVKKNSESLVS